MSKPTHPWNDPDGDGHSCVDCPDDSVWRCSETAHAEGVLPHLRPALGLNLNDPRDLLTPEELAELDADLAEIARQRRTAGGNLD